MYLYMYVRIQILFAKLKSIHSGTDASSAVSESVGSIIKEKRYVTEGRYGGREPWCHSQTMQQIVTNCCKAVKQGDLLLPVGTH